MSYANTRTATLYLHVGTAKTGPTYLQGNVWRNRQLPASRGTEPELLWRRLRSVLHLSHDGVDTDVRANVSRGAEGTWALAFITATTS